jgi:signal transduction histidine kinase
MTSGAATEIGECERPMATGDFLQNRLAEGDWPSYADLAAENERLRKALTLQSQLVAAVAHELRTPLTSVLGFTEVLLKREFESAARARFLRIVNSETRRFGRLIDELLDTQLTREGLNLVPEALDLAEILSEQVALFGAESDRHALELRRPAQPLLVWADRDRITQVVANLLSNAIKFSPEGGVVTVAAEIRDGRVRVSVTDDGTGIPTDEHHVLFSRFFRDQSRQASPAGPASIGLALSQEIVDAHGGSFGFDSSADQGSTFWFELHAHPGAVRGGAPFQQRPWE